MGRRLRNQSHLAAVVVVLALGLGGVALAQRASSSTSASVTLLDGKLKVSQTTFVPGTLTLVAVNHGKLSHALAIMGTGLQPRRTRSLGAGKSARLVVTIKVGRYMIWDPVRSSMSKATWLSVKATSAGSSGTTSPTGTTTGSGAGATSGGGTSSGSGTGSTDGASSGGTGTGTMPGMDPNDPCAGM